MRRVNLLKQGFIYKSLVKVMEDLKKKLDKKNIWKYYYKIQTVQLKTIKLLKL